MHIDRSDASITLTANEGNVLLGKAEATPAMLVDKNHPAGSYKTFAERVEHRASELHYETDRTVVIYVDGEYESWIAVYKGDGLVMESGE